MRKDSLQIFYTAKLFTAFITVLSNQALWLKSAQKNPQGAAELWVFSRIPLKCWNTIHEDQLEKYIFEFEALSDTQTQQIRLVTCWQLQKNQNTNTLFLQQNYLPPSVFALSVKAVV